MQLYHVYDRPLDLSTQMQELTRSTTNTLLSPLQVVAGDNDNEHYFDVKRIIDMDWNDTTHEVHTEFVPRHRLRGLDRTLLTILTKETIKEDLGPSRSTLLSVSRFCVAPSIATLRARSGRQSMSSTCCWTTGMRTQSVYSDSTLPGPVRLLGSTATRSDSSLTPSPHNLRNNPTQKKEGYDDAPS